jgi:prepilin-type N-terminal cleavage/methylation domain-containing protein
MQEKIVVFRLAPGNRRRAFTLIELLIVVLIIAILAAIAVPNLLEAQTRAKSARARADLRTVATALEAYCGVFGEYPPNRKSIYYSLPYELTTPIAFLTSRDLLDPFSLHPDPKTIPEQYIVFARYYSYHKIVGPEGMADDNNPWESIDAPPRNLTAFLKYGAWRMYSSGPDRTFFDGVWNTDERSFDIEYDPTNGTVSFGNIHRTQKYPQGTGNPAGLYP